MNIGDVRRHGLLAAGVLSGMAGFGLAVRMALSQELTWSFLVYNLALAWIPVALAAAMASLHETRVRGLTLPLGLVWLIFVPNAPYVVSDLIHIQPHPPIPESADAAIVALFAAAGVAAGLCSWSLVMAVTRRYVGPAASELGAALLALLTGFGITMGRYERFNSWDLWSEPMTILRFGWECVRHPGGHVHTWVVTAAYAGLVWAAWLAFRSLRGSDPAATTGAASW
jgi:uncharacterized membrane protein